MWRTSMPRLVLAFACLALLLPAGVGAQGATPTGADVAEEQLFATTLDLAPAAPIPVSLARITFDPGTGLSMTANPGPALHYVEAGGFTVLMSGSGSVVPAARPGVEEPVAPGVEFAIGPGDLLAIPTDTPFEVFNTGSEPAVALLIESFTRDPGGTLPAGIALEPLVVGEATGEPPGPVTVALVRTTLASGAALPPDASGGAALVAVETGTASLTVIAGEGDGAVGIYPKGGRSATPAPAGSEEEVGAGGGVVAQPNAATAIRNAGEVPLVLLRLSLGSGRSIGGTPVA